MANARVREVSREAAVRAFEQTPVPDPRGIATPESLAEVGEAFELRTDTGAGVFVLERHGAVLWVTAAAGQAADDLTDLGLQLIEETARRCGCSSVAFQTARRGLVRKAEGLGYQVGGWIMNKAIA